MELHYQAKNSGFEAIINERALSANLLLTFCRFP